MAASRYARRGRPTVVGRCEQAWVVTWQPRGTIYRQLPARYHRRPLAMRWEQAADWLLAAAILVSILATVTALTLVGLPGFYSLLR